MENKKQNFYRISQNRTQKIIESIQSLKNLSNSSFYEYTNEEIEEMFNSIIDEAEKTKKKLLDANKVKRRVVL